MFLVDEWRGYDDSVVWCRRFFLNGSRLETEQYGVKNETDKKKRSYVENVEKGNDREYLKTKQEKI